MPVPSSQASSSLETSVEYLSASQLKEFKKCQLQWYLDYVMKYDETNITGPYLDIGSAVHIAIEDALQGRDTIDDVPEIEDQMDTHFFREVNERGLSDSDIGDAHDMVNTAKKFMRKHEGMEIDGLEEYVKYGIDTDDLNHKMVAKMDLVLDNSIWDWKTGKVRPEDETVQGITYYVAYASRYGEFPDSVNFVYLKNGKVRKRTFEKSEWEENVLGIMKRMKMAFEQKRFPADLENGMCHWCGHRYHCPEHPTGFGDMEYTDWPPY